eukprot:9019779-Pyramimonas_sp.AAC.1
MGTDLTLLFWISSGIIQGCPSSGCIFALAADPFMSNFDASICRKDRGVVRACADDVGAALRRLEHLRVMHRIFSTARRVAALVLKLKKCVIAPLSGPHTPALRADYQQAISLL